MMLRLCFDQRRRRPFRSAILKHRGPSLVSFSMQFPLRWGGAGAVRTRCMAWVYSIDLLTGFTGHCMCFQAVKGCPYSVFSPPNTWQMMPFLNPLDALIPKSHYHFCANFWVRVTSEAQGSVSVGFWGSRELSPFGRGA